MSKTYLKSDHFNGGGSRASTLARYKKPRAYLTMDTLPRNAANKVLRQSLRETVTTERASGKSGRLYLVEG